ncbi:BTAD domain-containing putative transcriptional regulator [Streptomyces sp. NPDC052000]|uniref:AfsR/SARP family transcriptional regulator n=1 Tax=Streptomyces sp. NPDC052000 TaxID=3155676 RepID=UPI003450342B
MIRYHVLGPTRALHPDGSQVPLGGARLRALLAALAAGAGRAVPQSVLVAQVWGEGNALPADEIAAVQALVGRLRRALGRDAVESVPGGYRLAARAEEIDLFHFERLAQEGVAALAAGDPLRASGLLHDALALWQGPVLADLPARDGDPAVVRAERHHADARRHRLAAQVELGHAESALGELSALAATAPLDEPLQALHIRALRAAGRPAEALAAYESVRSALAERLGTGPGPQLLALHTELLNPERHADSALAGRTRTDPSRTVSPANAGPFERGSAAEPRTPPRRPAGNLRSRLTSFVGRESEVRELHSDLTRARLVTLTGPGGAGKTRLAVEAADGLAGQWDDGVWLAELAPVRDAESLPEAVLTALGARETRLGGPAETAPSDPVTQLLAHCARLRVLIVLDNCEQVIGAAAELVQELLTGCPGVTVLATSREPLGVPGERVRAVGPLPHESALRLFGQRGAAARTDFRTEEDPDAVAEICRRLDGLPLALELAAARLRMLTPRQIADRLDDRFRLLNTGPRTSRTLQPRQQTLRAVVDWSWELLDTPERAVLRRLAVFAGGFALAQAETVCADPVPEGESALAPSPGGVRSAVAETDVLDLLGSLVDKSLVVAAPGGDGAMRYRLLETVAEYAFERLEEAGERAAAELRHLAAYRELARTGERVLRGPRQQEVMECFEVEHDNVRAALRTAVDRRCEQDALCLTLAMAWFWQLRGHHAEARGWSRAVAALGPDPFAEPVRPAVPLTDRCTDRPPPWSEEQLWEARRGVGLMVFAAGGDAAAFNSPETVAYLRRVVSAYGTGLAQNTRQPGSVWYFARLLTGGFSGFDQAVDAMVADARTHGDPWDLAFTLLLRAKLLGGRDADEALALFERLGDPWAIAEALSGQGESYEREGRYEEAAAVFERALESITGTGPHVQVPEFTARLAAVRLETARTPAERDAAERLLREADAQSRRFPGDGISAVRLLLAQHCGRTGRPDAAREQLRAIEGEFSHSTPDLFRGLVAGMHGWLDCLDGKYADAQDRIQDAVRQLEAQAHLVAPNLITSQFLAAAWAKAGLGAARDGARLLGAYDRNSTGRVSFGFRPLPAESETRRDAEEAVRAVLDTASYERAHAEGAELDVRQAAALV